MLGWSCSGEAGGFRFFHLRFTRARTSLTDSENAQAPITLPNSSDQILTKYRLKSASGPLTGQTFDLGESTLLGSSENAGVRVEGLEAEHARIVRRDGGLVLEATGEVRVNGETVGEVALQSGDEIQMGTCRFVLQAPGLKPARVLDQVPEGRPTRWKWLVAAAVLAAAAAAGWFLFAPGAGP